MATDWHLYCLDCKEQLSFEDGRERVMITLIRHADVLSAFADPDLCSDDIVVSRFGRDIDAGWFRRHMGHNLSPIDEAGRLPTICNKAVRCGACEQWHRCPLDVNHPGDCNGR